VDAIGANHSVRVRTRAVGKMERDLTRALFQANY
jgi:hypothetical protein